MQRMHISGDAASTARVFAKDLHNKWGVGDGDCSDGVLMLLSIEDRQVLLEVPSKPIQIRHHQERSCCTWMGQIGHVTSP